MGNNIFGFPRKWINLRNTVNFVTEKFNSYCSITCINGINFNNITSYSELISYKVDIVAFILNFNKLVNKLISVFLHPLTQRNHHITVVYRVTEGVNAGYTCNNNYIPSFRECRSCRVT